MAKFKLKTELVATLIARGVIDGEGNMKIRVPHKANRISVETIYEVVFNPQTHALQTSNEHAARVLRGKHSPKIKSNGAWLISDPTVPWFDEAEDSDPMPGVVLDSDGTEMHTNKKRHVIWQYARETGAALPTDHSKVSLASHLTNAINYFKTK